MSTSQCQLTLRIKKDARLRNYCASSTTVNTRIISGILLWCKEKANQMAGNEKPQAVTGISFVACGF